MVESTVAILVLMLLAALGLMTWLLIRNRRRNRAARLAGSDSGITSGSSVTADLVDLEEAALLARTEEEVARNEQIAAMHNSIKKWGRGLLILGVIQLIAGGFLSAPWGIVLILVGGLSFLYREAEMFMLFAGVLALAAVSNLFSSQIYWIGFAILQVILAIGQYREFRKHLDLQQEVAEETATSGGGHDSLSQPELSRTSRIFPWLSLGLGAVGLAALVGIFAAALLVGLLGGTNLPEALIFAGDTLIRLGIMGLPVGIASLIARHPQRGMTIAGTVASGLLALMNYAIVLLL